MYKVVNERFKSGVNCHWDEYDELLSKAEELTGYKLTENEVREVIVYEFRYIIGNRLIRQIPLEIIAEMGVDLKIYGKDWEKAIPSISRIGLKWTGRLPKRKNLKWLSR